jgi:alpha-L-arabinofuranosidase
MRDDKSGEVILKIVNTDNNSIVSNIDLQGVETLANKGKAIVLTSDSALDENTLEEPTKVSPKNEMIELSGTILTRLFPGNSITVLRIPITKQK